MRALALAVVVGMAACAGPKEPVSQVTTFQDDRAFLEAHGKVLVLASKEGGQVLVSPAYQGRVMTSAVRADAPSLGWVNRSFVTAGKTGTAFDNFGGEDRFWLGPEGGQYGLYFPPGKPYEFDLWQTPHELQEGAWEVKEAAADRVVFTRTMTVTNWSGTSFTVAVERTVRLLGRSDVDRALGASSGGLAFVAYETQNTIRNAGKEPWKKETGLLSVWILAQLAPSPDARVLIPFEKGATGPVVNDRYFGKIPPERLRIDEEKGFLSFVCDGQQRGKLGLSAVRAKSILGSFSERASLLTLVTYDGPKRGAPYVNSMWEQQSDPYAGDVVNSYNDGPTAPGKPALGGFYEIETSSPAVSLSPGETATHTHRTFHFVGPKPELGALAQRTLGVAL